MVGDGLNRSDLDRFCQVSFFTTCDNSVRDFVLIETFAYLLNQLYSMCDNQYLCVQRLQHTPCGDITNNRSEQARLASTSWHLEHHAITCVPSGKDFFLCILLIWT